MLPSEMLPLSHNAVNGNGNVIRQGIAFDRVGRRVAFHFLRRHPGDILPCWQAHCGCQVMTAAAL